MSLYLGENCISAGGSSAFKNNNIGEIIQSTIPLTDAGLHLLDGSLISGSGSYSAFVTYMAGLVSDYPDCFCSEADWQQTVTDYGVCGKFVYDSVNNTVRLPKITGFTEGTIDPTVLGDLTEAGLPNITGQVGIYAAKSTSSSTTVDNMIKSGAFSDSYGTALRTTPSSTTGTTSCREGIYVLDASDSNSIYGNSTTVQPQSIKVLYYIVIATLTKTDIEVDIDEIATDLNGKADVDLSNLNSTGQKVIDGQWVEKYLTVASSETAPTTTPLSYSLSSYLPDDGYNYEVIGYASGTTGSSSGNRITLKIMGDILTNSNRIAQVITRTSSAMICSGYFKLPIGANRWLKMNEDSNNTGTFSISLIGYRRIGTNS